jgi:hypothetical protein
MGAGGAGAAQRAPRAAGRAGARGGAQRQRRTSQIQTSPWFQVMGTLAMDRKDQPKGICEPPMHSICLLWTL